MPLAARLATEIGTRAFLRIYWGEVDCPNCFGKGKPGYHNAKVFIGETSEIGAWKFLGEPQDYVGDPRWPRKCDHCEALVPEDAKRQVFRDRWYDTSSGVLEPGCLYYADWYHWKASGDQPEGGCVHGWTNCDGRHLMAILPNGYEWDIDGRASNCGLRQDNLHRCWVRTGTPPLITVGKGPGPTCPAGGGSIQAGDYHGFLRDGVFT